jgi:hypothetical protein
MMFKLRHLNVAELDIEQSQVLNNSSAFGKDPSIWREIFVTVLICKPFEKYLHCTDGKFPLSVILPWFSAQTIIAEV